VNADTENLAALVGSALAQSRCGERNARMDQLLNTRLVAEMLGVTQREIRRKVQTGALQGFKIGPRSLRVALSEVGRFLNDARSIS
jgi:predicted DNA-binding transcriptional regulator AlpA